LSLRFGTITHILNGQTLRFCCQGCRMVYTMLLESAEVDDPGRFRESDLYRQCVAAGVIPASEDDLYRIQEEERSRPTRTGTPVEATDAAPVPGDTLALNLTVEGMWCPACAWVIEKSVSRLSGVGEVNCHFSTDRLRCRYRPDRVAPDQIRDAVARLGYGVRETGADDTSGEGRRRELIRLSISGLLSANVMMLSWALYAGFFTTLPKDAVSKISLPIVAMATTVFIYGGGPMLRKAWFGVVHRMPGMETLVSLAAGFSFLYSLFNWLTGSIHLYFDTACMLITLVLLGKVLEQQAKDRVRRDLNSFFALQPAKVRLIADAWPEGRYVSIGRLSTGDRFAVEADETVPADGRVQSGTAVIDESSLTGEPRPVAVRTGDIVKNGTRVIDGRVIAMAEKVGWDTVLGRMIAIMTRSLEQKSTFEGRTDRMLAWFVPVIVAVACGTGILCAAAGLPVHQSLVRTVTVMVISCPCALGVAIPMARLAGISLAGRRGILVREIEAFERSDAIDTVVFDKTGTLTRGRWQLDHIICEPGYEREAVMGWAFGLERATDHEIARSIDAYCRTNGIPPVDMTAVERFPDGVEGRWDGKAVRIGRRGFAWHDLPVSPAAVDAPETPPASRVYLGIDDRRVATIVFGDAIRTSVPTMIDAMKHNGLDLHLVSGDGHATTREVARAIGLTEARGDLMPAEKAAYIDDLAARGRTVAMVGDGINDAAAMARAHLAVAIHSGAGLAREAAHITLMRGDPVQLLDFFPLSRRVNRKVVQNLWCAWIYNLVGIPVAMSGLLNPLIAATAMLLSSLTVIGNTLLLVRRS
jgi:heavy metal translocating P-type ATPase